VTPPTIREGSSEPLRVSNCHLPRWMAMSNMGSLVRALLAGAIAAACVKSPCFRWDFHAIHSDRGGDAMECGAKTERLATSATIPPAADVVVTDTQPRWAKRRRRNASRLSVSPGQCHRAYGARGLVMPFLQRVFRPTGPSFRLRSSTDCRAVVWDQAENRP
jgi:hypothetical protein